MKKTGILTQQSSLINWGAVEDEEFEWHTRENGFERDADDYCDLDNWWDENEESEEATEVNYSATSSRT